MLLPSDWSWSLNYSLFEHSWQACRAASCPQGQMRNLLREAFQPARGHTAGRGPIPSGLGPPTWFSVLRAGGLPEHLKCLAQEALCISSPPSALKAPGSSARRVDRSPDLTPSSAPTGREPQPAACPPSLSLLIGKSVHVCPDKGCWPRRGSWPGSFRVPSISLHPPDHSALSGRRPVWAQDPRHWCVL